MINGFLKASHLDNTVILDYWDTNKLFNNKPEHQIDKINVNQYDYIVGPYLINGNHWTAIIIDVQEKLFLAIDPQIFKSDLLDNQFEIWLQYCIRHESSSVWKKTIIDHPIQNDEYNCGVFVMLFITNYIKNGRINFETHNLHSHRLIIAETIKNYK